ncbi:Crp/Fnr family transcriptional regulator [Amaricoccus macauensis]|uniref:Crp/Fnr family transcriptional regulator n=1 Tax=Amaricoccus macauensis TaxID=57001 RepID=UPI003C79C116
MSCQEFFERLERACGDRNVRVIDLTTGELLFRQGDNPPGLASLCSGQIALVRWTKAGRSVRIHTACAGETFAEASLHAEACHCDAVALAPSHVHLVPKRLFEHALENDRDLARDYALYLARSLMQSRRLLELRAVTPLTERVLIRLVELAGSDGVVPVEISLTSLASDLGVTPPAFYRAIASLETRGDLERPARGRIRLLGPLIRDDGD